MGTHTECFYREIRKKISICWLKKAPGAITGQIWYLVCARPEGCL